MFLPSRLKTIGNFIEPWEIVADIGADHGLLELYLLAKSPDIKIIAIENKVGPYKNLDLTLRSFKNIRLSLSDGLEAVDKSVTTVVIAGMGGFTIKNIIEKYPEKVKHLEKIIIDAHRDQKFARKAIINLGFKIEKEKIVLEQEKFYVITEFIKSEGNFSYSDDDLEFGYKIYEDELWGKYQQYLKEKNNLTLDKIKNKDKLQDKILKIKKLNERIDNYGKN